MAAPPISVIAFIAVMRARPALIKRFVFGSALFIVSVMGAARLDVSFMSTPVNVACLAAAYLAYVFLAASFWLVKPLILRVPALVIAAVPVLAGYMMGTVGLLGLAFIIGDYANPPLQTLRIDANLECRVIAWGNATADSGYTVHLYRQAPLIPFVEREVSRVRVNETRPGPGPATASCKDALAAMH